MIIQGIVDQIHTLNWGRPVNLGSKIYVQFGRFDEKFLLLSPAGCLVERFVEATQVRHYGVGDEIFSAFSADHRMLALIYSSRQQSNWQASNHSQPRPKVRDLLEGNRVSYVVRTFAIDWFDRQNSNTDETRQNPTRSGLIESEFHITIYQTAQFEK